MKVDQRHGVLKYECWKCQLRIEGPFDFVLPLVRIHQAECENPALTDGDDDAR